MHSFSVVIGLLFFVSGAVSWPSTRYRTEKFRTPYFNVTRSASEPTANGYLFMGMNQAPNPEAGPLIVDDTGELVWHGSLSPGTDRANNIFVQTLNNKPVLTYWDGVGFDFHEAPAHGYGSITILDNTYTPLYQNFCLPPAVNSDIRTPIPYLSSQCFIDGHESYINSERNSIIVTVYNTTQANLTAVGGREDGWIFDVLFYELDLASNEVLFSWSAMKHLDITASNFINTTGLNKLQFGDTIVGRRPSKPWDPFHINSVQSIPGGYLVNSRMLWSFYIVDGKTGKISHTVEGSHGGDFTLRDNIFFSWEHHVRLLATAPDGTMYISLFNNDNIPNIEPNINGSSGYLLALDFKHRTVSQVDQYRDPSRLIMAYAEGSYQNLSDGHTFIGFGARPFVEEYGKSQITPIYTAQYADNGKKTGMHSYRAYRLPWIGQPAHPPKAVAYYSINSTTIHVAMSWNGATEYVAWNIFTDEIIVAHDVSKTGFETLYSITSKKKIPPKKLNVQALDTNGNVLGTSKTVAITT